MNFALIIVVLTAITGFITLIDVLFFAKHRKTAMPKLIEQARSFFPFFLQLLFFGRS